MEKSNRKKGRRTRKKKLGKKKKKSEMNLMVTTFVLKQIRNIRKTIFPTQMP
jgi:hypothetical protein